MPRDDAPDPGAEDANNQPHDTSVLRHVVDSLSVPRADAVDVQLQAAANSYSGDDYDLYESLLAELEAARRDAPPAEYVDDAPLGYRDQIAAELAEWKTTDEFDLAHADYLLDRHRPENQRGSHWATEAAEVRAYTDSRPELREEDQRIGAEATEIVRRMNRLLVESKVVWNDWHSTWEKPRPAPTYDPNRRVLTESELLERFDKVRPNHRGWTARCPGHQDRSPSLSIRQGDRWWLLHCFAGCTSQQICDAIGLRVADLWLGGDDG